jgi:hypothetical protein
MALKPSRSTKVIEQAAIGQAGQRVVVGLVPDVGFGKLALGDVGEIDDGAHRPVAFDRIKTDFGVKGAGIAPHKYHVVAVQALAQAQCFM